MEQQNSGSNFKAGGVIFGLGIVGYAAYNVFKKVKAAKEQKAIDVTPTQPQEQVEAAE